MEIQNNKSIALLHDLGLNTAQFDEQFLLQCLQNRYHALKLPSIDHYQIYLKGNKTEVALLKTLLYNGYSIFFRNPITFSVLEKIIIPSIIAKNKNTHKKEIRIWSAACGAGQEVYTLAMILENYYAANNIPPNYRIFATDIDEKRLNEAQIGAYASSLVQNVSLKNINQWFTKVNNTYVVHEKLRQNINFSKFDLLNQSAQCPEASIYGEFDLVIFANILFYYKPEFRIIILSKCKHCLSKDGYLITGETERELLKHLNYTEVYSESSIFQP